MNEKYDKNVIDVDIRDFLVLCEDPCECKNWTLKNKKYKLQNKTESRRPQTVVQLVQKNFGFQNFISAGKMGLHTIRR